MEVFSEATDAFSEDSIDRRFEVVDVLVGYFRENRVSETRDLGDFKDQVDCRDVYTVRELGDFIPFLDYYYFYVWREMGDRTVQLDCKDYLDFSDDLDLFRGEYVGIGLG